MSTKLVYIVGNHPYSKPIVGNPTFLLQAQSLGYIKVKRENIPVIDIHETSQGIQIEIDKKI